MVRMWAMRSRKKPRVVVLLNPVPGFVGDSDGNVIVPLTPECSIKIPLHQWDGPVVEPGAIVAVDVNFTVVDLKPTIDLTAEEEKVQ